MVDPDGDVLELVRDDQIRAALEQLMRRYGTAVYRYCRAELRDEALADDVQQQVFIEAFRDLPRFKRISTVRIWLFGIARHRVLDAAKQRTRRRNRFEPVDDAGVDAEDARPSPGESLDDARLRLALVACLSRLGDDARTAVLLHYQLGVSFEDMSKICGEKPGTLHARVARSLLRLRALIESRIARAR